MISILQMKSSYSHSLQMLLDILFLLISPYLRPYSSVTVEHKEKAKLIFIKIAIGNQYFLLHPA